MWPRGRRNYYTSRENIHQPSNDTWQNATVEENRIGHSMARENEPFSRNNRVNYNASRERGQRLNTPLFPGANPSDDSDNESVASNNSDNQNRQHIRYGGYARRNAPNTSQRVNQPVSYPAENTSSRHNFPQAARRSNNWGRGRGRSNRGSGYPNQSNRTQGDLFHFSSSSGQQRASQAECAPSSNAISLSNKDKIALMTDFKNILQTLNPSDLIKEYRQRINKMQENCLGKHEKRFKKISSANKIANNKEKPILEKHLDIIKQQLRTFEHYISNIKAELSDMYVLPQKVVYNSCEEKLEEAKNECKIFKKSLPIYAYKAEILSSVAKNQVTIVSVDACYSSGEMIPLFLHQAYCNDVVLVCEPNNATAISLAQNCKISGGSDTNNSIAYKTDNSDETTKDSKIIFLSALKLYQECMKDPHLSDYKIIVLQCDLKRSIETDFLIECLRNCLKERANLRLILILPPLCDSSKFVSYFSSTTIETLKTPNIIFPVQTVWKNSPSSFDLDYVHEVVDTALGIHALNEKGDVLIFLPTYSDVEKTSKILSLKLIQYSYHDASCILMHEDTFDQSNFNFPEPGGNNSSKRRFFLTTSWTEVFPLPSVVYVIDTGIQKRLQYDQQKAADFLKETFISRERAKLRKYCAGRYSTGICFRLYSKHDYLSKMPLRETSEVLCKNPLEIMVKLFQYCPERAMKVEFVENMSNEVKVKTSIMLKNANAVKDGKLTTLGEQIVKLPFLPKYSKLIVIGIQWGFSFEVIVLVAFFVVNKPVFTHSTDDREIRRKEEATKLQYISFDSDTLTNLNIYRKWILNDCLESWCIDRALSFSVLTEIQAKVKDIVVVVGRNLKEDVNSFIKSEKEMDCLALQEMLFDCFKENLCVYTGHHRSGYHFLGAECITFLHPSSSILQKSNLPEFVVFDHLDVCSRHFMMGVTAIPKSVIMSFVKKGLVNFDEADLSKKKLEPVTLENFGVTLIKHVLLGRKGRKLMEIEDEIKKETKCDLIVIEPSEEKGTVTVFAPPTCTKKAEMMIRQVLESKLESVFNEEDTLVLELKRVQSTVPIHITWKKGAVITKLKPELQGARPEVKKNEGQSDNDESSTKQCINLTWIRRLCKGFGFLTFADKDFMVARRLAMTSVTVNGTEADIQINKNFDNQLYITGLPSDATDEDLKMAFNSILEKQFFGNAQVEKANVIVQKPFETTDEQLHHLQDQIYNDVYKLFGTNNFTVSVPKPKNTAMIMEAYISFSSPAGLEQRAILLGDSLKIDDVPVKAVPVFSASVIYNINVFNVLKEKMESDLRQLDNSLRQQADFSNVEELFKLNVESYDNGLACLKLSTSKEQIINSLQRLVNKWLEGEIITSQNFRKLHKLFTHGGHLWLKALAVQEGVHIMDEYKSKSLRLYGTKKRCQLAIDRIKQYLHNTKNEIVTEINLSNGKHVRTLLKAVIRKYGVDLKNFMQEFHLRSASINIRNAQLIFHGDSDNVEQAMSALEDLASSCSSDVQDEFVQSQEICCTCIMPPLQSSIRLEHCGHLYCAECLKGLIMNAKFPILCGAEDCEKELILEDIRRGLDDDDDEVNRLLNLAMNDFIMKNKEDFIYCPAPDCSMFFEKKEISGTKWRCRLCQNDICIQCNVVFHHGYTCKMYQGTKDDPNYSYKMWLKDTNANCKACPKCNTGIEKTIGCNHMTCNMCHAHFCWMCLKLFPNGRGIYDHIPYCTGN